MWQGKAVNERVRMAKGRYGKACGKWLPAELSVKVWFFITQRPESLSLGAGLFEGACKVRRGGAGYSRLDRSITAASVMV